MPRRPARKPRLIEALRKWYPGNWRYVSDCFCWVREDGTWADWRAQSLDNRDYFSIGCKPGANLNLNVPVHGPIYDKSQVCMVFDASDWDALGRGLHDLVVPVIVSLDSRETMTIVEI